MATYIEIFPASYGDCFLVRLIGEDSKPFHILIDGGFSTHPYKNTLKPRLKALKKEGFQIDLLVVTHIDADHINGIIALLKENENDAIIPIKEIWFNGFRHIDQWNKGTAQLTPKQKQYLMHYIRGGRPEEENMERGLEDMSPDAGSSLTELIIERKIKWNASFFGNAVIQGNAPTFRISPDISITILSPSQKILEELNQEWKKELGKDFENVKDELLPMAVEYILAQIQDQIPEGTREIGEVKKNLNEYLTSDFQEDEAIPNKSSISFIIEFKRKKLLFLGDSHPSVILQGLKHYRPKAKKLKFDVIKVSHHGSDGNTSPELLDFIEAKHFIVSTNGQKFNHPGLSCLARIVCRPTDKGKVRNLVFNYDTTIAYQEMKKPDWQKEYKYTIHPVTNPFITIKI